VKIKQSIGLRGKLSIIFAAAVLGLAAVLTFLTSNYLGGVINEEYGHRASIMASFLEANLTAPGGGISSPHVQTEIDALKKQNTELQKISLYAPNANGEVVVVASTDRSLLGGLAEADDSLPISTDQSTMVDEGASGNDGAPGEENAQGNGGTLELLAPLHDETGKPVASVGIYLDGATRDGLVRTQQIYLAVVTNLALLALLAVLYFSLNRMFIHPIKELTHSTLNIGQPDWSPPAATKRRDEVGSLALAFDQIAGSLTARDEEVKILLDASVAVSSALHVDKILQILCERIASSKMVSYCRISLLDRSGKSLVVKAASPTREISEWDKGIGHRIDLSLARHHSQVIASGKPTVLKKSGQLSVSGNEEEWEWALTPDTRSALLMPLVSKDNTIGVVTLGEVRHWERTPFTAKKIEFYQTLMNQAAVAIENAKLYEKTEWHVRELSAMHNMSLAFTSTLDYQEVISVVAQRVGSLIGAQYASVLLPDEHNRYLNIVASYNLSAEYVWTINKKRRIPVGVGPVGKAFTSHKPVVTENVYSDADYGLWKHIASVQGYSSQVALPLMAKGLSIGVICIYFSDPRHLRDDEIDLLVTSANEAAIAIDNARIYENLQDAFVGTIRSLAETIDAKDTYTRGHSERVSLYAEAIARSLGLQGEELQTIRYAGYLHDVGKIGIPDSILSKPGKLTIEEFRVIKKHPVLSERILKPVSFPFPVQSLVRHHHERYDGNGYPDNLSGEEIPLGARILFVADAYEAMTSDRPYRKALSTETALDELRNNVTTQFDPRVVAAFQRIIKTEAPADRKIRMGA